jgi:hypothetical protein
VDVGPVDFRIARWAERPDAVACSDRRALCDGDRAEVNERHGIPIGCEDREALAVRRNGPSERHAAGDRCPDRTCSWPADIDATVLPRRIRVGGVERERCEYDTIDGPYPR